MTPERFAGEFTEADGLIRAKEQSFVKANPWSVSTNEAVAREFAHTDDSANISVFYRIELIQARDIKSFSKYGSEDEVLCLPGAAFAVESVTETNQGAGPRQIVVTIRQTR